MSNHDGSYLLNEVIALLRRERVFEHLGKRTSQRIVAEIVRRADAEYDCNPGEILDGHGEALGVCYHCVRPVDTLVIGLCTACRDELGITDEELVGAPGPLPERSGWGLPEAGRAPWKPEARAPRPRAAPPAVRRRPPGPRGRGTAARRRRG